MKATIIILSRLTDVRIVELTPLNLILVSRVYMVHRNVQEMYNNYVFTNMRPSRTGGSS